MVFPVVKIQGYLSHYKNSDLIGQFLMSSICATNPSGKYLPAQYLLLHLYMQYGYYLVGFTHLNLCDWLVPHLLYLELRYGQITKCQGARLVIRRARVQSQPRYRGKQVPIKFYPHIPKRSYIFETLTTIVVPNFLGKETIQLYLFLASV